MAVAVNIINTYFGRCRCCLNYGYLKNMWEEHYRDGEKEIYVQMLVECFALEWEQSDDENRSRLDQICETCIVRLREAYSFKNTVLESQVKLLNHYEEPETPIKIGQIIECKEEGSESEDVERSPHEKASDIADCQDSGDPDYVDTDDPCYLDQEDTEDMDYENVEYLEEEDIKEEHMAQEEKLIVNSTYIPSPTSKTKWPKKLPNSERYKTFKQYTEEELAICLKAVKNKKLTAREASRKFNIPRSTIRGNLRIDAQDSRAVANAEIKKVTNNTANQKLHAGTKITKNSIMLSKNRHNLVTLLTNSNATMMKSNVTNCFACNFCDERFDTPQELKWHTKNHGDVTGKVFRPKYLYLSHLVVKVDITHLTCNMCTDSVIFGKLETFFDHLVMEHDIIVHKDTNHFIIPFKFDTEELHCCVCSKKFKHFKMLSEHMSEHYGNHVCEICQKSFITKHAMTVHKTRHQIGEFKCALCPKIFDTKPKVRDHEKSAHLFIKKILKCPICGQRFTSKYVFQKHEEKCGRSAMFIE